MNRSYFGDTRDLFKYDLVRHIMKALPGFERFTLIPMLTESDEKASGKKSTAKDLGKAEKAGKAGSQNRDLVAHMQRLQEIDEDLEYFQHISSYFKQENILVDILHKHRFSHPQRGSYFTDIFTKFPKKSLIFLDPDIGLEESAPTERHLLFDEVKKIYDRMDTGSTLMIYQHFPRVSRKDYVDNRCSQLSEITGTKPVTITDNEIVFFLLAKNPKLKTQLELVILKYANSYPALISCSCE
jgi:hypothetical protein